jgi:hypothetical protein
MKVRHIAAALFILAFAAVGWAAGKPVVSVPGASIIPAVAHTAGINSHWRSDVRIYNPDTARARYDLFFTPSGVDGTQTGLQTSIDVDSHATAALDDVLASTFAIDHDAAGALEIRPAGGASAPVVTSRAYDVTANGTLGQYVPAIPVAQFARKGEIVSLQQVAQSAAYRTNFGVVEGSGSEAAMNVRIFDDPGSKLAEFPLTLAPYEHIQINSMLAEHGIAIDDARIEVEVTSDSGTIAPYASVIDKISNDPLLVPPVVPAKIAANTYYIPGIADLDTPSNAWRTDLRIYNGGLAQTYVVATFLPAEGIDRMTTGFAINPGEVKAFNGVVSSLFGLHNTGGALRIFTSLPQTTSLVVTARTYDAKGGGTRGQFIPGAGTLAGGIVAGPPVARLGGPPVELLHVEQSERYRTNFGFAETNGQPATVRIDVTVADGRHATATVDLAASEYRQYNGLLHEMGLDNATNARLEARVISGLGKVTTYASVIDNQTQDPTYIPAQ